MNIIWMVPICGALAILFLGLSLLLVILRGAPDETTIMQTGHVGRWARFLYAYVVGWAFIASISIGMPSSRQKKRWMRP